MSAKKILYIYDYERIVPPFLMTLIKEWVDKFDEIKYITPPMPENYVKLLDNPKIEMLTWNKRQRAKQYVKGVMSIFRPWLWNEAFKGKISKNLIAHLGKYFFCSDGFIGLSEKLIKKNIENGNEVFLFSTWFSVDTFIIARLRKKYPTAKAFALAHSGEVILERNPYMFQTYHEYMLENINKVFFISRNVMRDYLKDTEHKEIEKRFGNKITSLYLGSLKNNNLMNPEESISIPTILSCSRIDSNKRLEKIISALTKWKTCKIKWIHIGVGESENKIKEQVRELERSNSNVMVEMMGRLSNREVLDFYSKNHIDLFMNVSKSEGLPISIMEAMSYGIPCIATNVGGTSEIVNESNGYLLDRDFSDEDLIEKLENFINSDTDTVKSLRRQAYRTWEDNFNASNNAQKIIEIFEST